MLEKRRHWGHYSRPRHLLCHSSRSSKLAKLLPGLVYSKNIEHLSYFDIIVSSANYLKYLWVCVVTYSIKKVFWRQRVTGEDMKTCENNLVTILSEKKKFDFFWWFLSSEISKKCHFISPQNGFLPTLRSCKKFEKCYEDKQKFLWKLRHRAFKRTNSHVHTTAIKKVLGIFRKKRSRVYPLE